MSRLSLWPPLPFRFPGHRQGERSTARPQRTFSRICLPGAQWVCWGQHQAQWLPASSPLGGSGSGRRDRWPPPSPPGRAGGKIADDKGALDDRPWPAQLHLAPVHVAGKVIAATPCQHEDHKSASLFQGLSEDCSIPLRNFPKDPAKESQVPEAPVGSREPFHGRQEKMGWPGVK